MDAARTESPRRSAAWLERLQALLLVLPGAWLAWPGPLGPTRDDPYPELAGAGWALFFALASAALLLVRRASPSPRGLAAWLAVLGAGALSAWIHPPGDTLEASRAVLVASAGTAALLAGSTLTADGRAWLARALVLLSLFTAVPALLDAARGHAGALGNSGSTAELALPGALAGAFSFAGASLAWGALDLAATAAYAWHAGLAPVHAGTVSFLLACAALGLARAGKSRAAPVPRRLALALFVFLACAAGGSLARSLRRPVDPATGVHAARSGDTGGIEVRLRVARASLSMLGDHAALGAGPGQFGAAFPPYRDPREIELSTHGRTLPGWELEVWHAHDDWLQGFLDVGIAGGAAWVAFLLAALAGGASAARGSDPARAALGAAALGVLAFALFRGPLAWDPASSSLGFGLFGAVLASPRSPFARPLAARVLVLACVLLLLSQAPRAWAIVQHGRALAEVWPHARERLRGPERVALDRALARCPDSTTALALSARDRERSGDAERARAEWEAVLERRPHSIEALLERGKLSAIGRDFAGARASLERVLALDPGHPVARRNLALALARASDAEGASEHARILRGQGRLPEAEIESWAVERFRELQPEVGFALLAVVDSSWRGLTPERAFERGQELRESAPALGAALQGVAHLEWAREQAAAGDFASAVRSYRQARSRLGAEDKAGAGGLRVAPLLLAELAAAEARVGREEVARAALAEIEITSEQVLRLPSWAAETLMPLGLLGRVLPSGPR